MKANKLHQLQLYIVKLANTADNFTSPREIHNNFTLIKANPPQIQLGKKAQP